MLKINRAFLGAYRKGRQAAAEDKPFSACPYADDATFSTAFYRYWTRGWKEIKAGCDCQNPCPDQRWLTQIVWHYSDICPVHTTKY